MDEPALKQKLKGILVSDFIIREEVQGKSIVDDSPLRADFLIYPTRTLIARGFSAEWFGVEVKEISFAQCDAKKLYGTFWQAVCYSQTNFVVDGNIVRPAGCALYIGDFGRQSNDSVIAGQLRRWWILLELGVYANTGYFSGNTPQDWALWFGQGRYFSKADGMTKIPRGLKRYTGNVFKKVRQKRATKAD